LPHWDETIVESPMFLCPIKFAAYLKMKDGGHKRQGD
jgi:hypothetical protein